MDLKLKIYGCLCSTEVFEINGDWTKFSIESLSKRAYNDRQKLKTLRKCVM